MLSILNRGMPGGDGGDLDLILDNDTIPTHMGKSGAAIPRGSRRQISILCGYYLTDLDDNRKVSVGVTVVVLRNKQKDSKTPKWWKMKH